MPLARIESAGNSGSSREEPHFVLYVEGPRDRDILLIWARRLFPPLARKLEANVVILGGRQPARARAHFREFLAVHPSAQGMCVLDRDDGAAQANSPDTEAPLEFFTWSRRHIESYLLVREAILRCLRRKPGDTRVASLVERLIPDSCDEASLQQIDAKRLLSAKGPLAQELGRALDPGRIARAQRQSELHPDVVDLMNRVLSCAGLAAPPPQVVSKAFSRG